MGGLHLKIAFTLTALSPASIVYGIVQLTNDNTLGSIIFCLIGLLGILIYRLLIYWVRKKLPVTKLEISEITPSDSKLLGYIITYFIPILDDKILSTPLLIVIFCLLFLVIIFSYANWYNPLHFLFRYHYYDIKDTNVINKTIISKQKLNSTKVTLQVRELGPYQFIQL